jgi:hypothetical protein
VEGGLFFVNTYRKKWGMQGIQAALRRDIFGPLSWATKVAYPVVKFSGSTVRRSLPLRPFDPPTERNAIRLQQSTPTVILRKTRVHPKSR